MLWGGLIPIPSQLFLDAITLGTWTYGILSRSMLWIIAGCYLILSTSGWTKRWTITFPMIPLLVLQAIRLLVVHVRVETITKEKEVQTKEKETTHAVQQQPPKSSSSLSDFCSRLWTILCLLCVVSATALSILFPAVQLPNVTGPYAVGVLDMKIPMQVSVKTKYRNRFPNNNETTTATSPISSTLPPTLQTKLEHQHLPVRIFYPTRIGNNKPSSSSTTKTTSIPYLLPHTAHQFCQLSMKFAAPEPLKTFDWMLHHWLLTTLPVVVVTTEAAESTIPTRMEESDKTMNEDELLPLVVFSHGLGGSADLYAFQAMELASHGAIVVSINHKDGSAPIVDDVELDENILQLYRDGMHVEYARERRWQTDRRAQEMIAVTEFLHQNWTSPLNSSIPPQLLSLFIRNTTTNNDSPHQLRHRTHWMGHSFGGATALTAAWERPDLVRFVVAHEPAVDWIPDPARRDLFHPAILNEIPQHNYTGGTGGFEKEEEEQEEVQQCDTVTNSSSLNNTSILHDLDLLILNSEEWQRKNWGETRLLEAMHRRGRLGRSGGISKHGIIAQSMHNEFSDTCMLTPVWLARAIGITGPRNPIDTSMEIAQWTRSFVEQARRL
jgi:platelet-activating factor acetylhydrolase